MLLLDCPIDTTQHHTKWHNTIQHNTIWQNTIQHKLPPKGYIILIFTSFHCVSPIAQWYSIGRQTRTLPLSWVRVPATPLFVIIFFKFFISSSFLCLFLTFHLQDTCVMSYWNNTTHLNILCTAKYGNCLLYTSPSPRD